MRALSTFLVLLTVAACGSGPSGLPTPTPIPSGDWLGQPLPGSEPVLFAPGEISTELTERDTAWSPDGREVYWTVWSAQSSVILSRHRGPDGTWNSAERVAALNAHDALEPFITTDGRWLWFASPRPLPGESERGDWNLWRAPRTASGWGTPEPIPAPTNGDGDEFYPTLTRDGTLLFTAQLEDSLGGEDLYLAAPEGDGWAPAVNLGPAINSPGPDFNALIHPDGSWILFSSVRDGDAGGGDLYVSFRAEDGWSPARAVEALNGPLLDFCPALSADGDLLFFTSRRFLTDPFAAAAAAELYARLRAPGNGAGDIFWVRSEVLEQYRD
jgi:Tol biopolymer transport system component